MLLHSTPPRCCPAYIGYTLTVIHLFINTVAIEVDQRTADSQLYLLHSSMIAMV